MNIQPDFEELLRLFAIHEVEYMIVGGYAVAFHGYARFTKDIDLFYATTPANIDRLRAALIAFGFSQDEIPPETFLQMGNVAVFGVAPLRVDLLNQIDGVTFDQAFPNAVTATYGAAPARFIGREDLIKNKKSTRRTQDKADVEELE
ncbi:MAG: nucleotidyltransferase [Candidatus Sumerlaeaceae bacterium]|nr:nucleotidyltransferase [Candidatus Sumerlaeaceae bacterium]